MDPIKDIVSGVIRRMSSSKGGIFEDIQAAWTKISNDQASRVVDFKEGCITVSAKDSFRLVRLNLNRENILKQLQKEFPSIVKISFKVATN